MSTASNEPDGLSGGGTPMSLETKKILAATKRRTNVLKNVLEVQLEKRAEGIKDNTNVRAKEIKENTNLRAEEIKENADLRAAALMKATNLRAEDVQQDIKEHHDQAEINARKRAEAADEKSKENIDAMANHAIITLSAKERSLQAIHEKEEKIAELTIAFNAAVAEVNKEWREKERAILAEQKLMTPTPAKMG